MADISNVWAAGAQRALFEGHGTAPADVVTPLTPRCSFTDCSPTTSSSSRGMEPGWSAPLLSTSELGLRSSGGDDANFDACPDALSGRHDCSDAGPPCRGTVDPSGGRGSTLDSMCGFSTVSALRPNQCFSTTGYTAEASLYHGDHHAAEPAGANYRARGQQRRCKGAAGCASPAASTATDFAALGCAPDLAGEVDLQRAEAAVAAALLPPQNVPVRIQVNRPLPGGNITPRPDGAREPAFGERPTAAKLQRAGGSSRGMLPDGDGAGGMAATAGGVGAELAVAASAAAGTAIASAAALSPTITVERSRPNGSGKPGLAGASADSSPRPQFKAAGDALSPVGRSVMYMSHGVTPTGAPTDKVAGTGDNGASPPVLPPASRRRQLREEVKLTVNVLLCENMGEKIVVEKRQDGAKDAVAPPALHHADHAVSRSAPLLASAPVTPSSLKPTSPASVAGPVFSPSSGRAAARGVRAPRAGGADASVGTHSRKHFAGAYDLRSPGSGRAAHSGRGTLSAADQPVVAAAYGRGMTGFGVGGVQLQYGYGNQPPPPQRRESEAAEIAGLGSPGGVLFNQHPCGGVLSPRVTTPGVAAGMPPNGHMILTIPGPEARYGAARPGAATSGGMGHWVPPGAAADASYPSRPSTFDGTISAHAAACPGHLDVAELTLTPAQCGPNTTFGCDAASWQLLLNTTDAATRRALVSMAASCNSPGDMATLAALVAHCVEAQARFSLYGGVADATAAAASPAVGRQWAGNAAASRADPWVAAPRADPSANVDSGSCGRAPTGSELSAALSVSHVNAPASVTSSATPPLSPCSPLPDRNAQPAAATNPFAQRFMQGPTGDPTLDVISAVDWSIGVASPGANGGPCSALPSPKLSVSASTCNGAYPSATGAVRGAAGHRHSNNGIAGGAAVSAEPPAPRAASLPATPRQPAPNALINTCASPPDHAVGRLPAFGGSAWAPELGTYGAGLQATPEEGEVSSEEVGAALAAARQLMPGMVQGPAQVPGYTGSLSRQLMTPYGYVYPTAGGAINWAWPAK